MSSKHNSEVVIGWDGCDEVPSCLLTPRPFMMVMLVAVPRIGMTLREFGADVQGGLKGRDEKLASGSGREYMFLIVR